MISMDKLTLKAQEALSKAQQVALERSHQQIEPLHILSALLAQQEGIVRSLLKKIGENPDLLY
ncbi:hypothetical protein JXO59_10565, partial [candidate division KSB1 bacterium]|nr:hypothetical protein [candidate division KSB1 bacterium]